MPDSCYVYAIVRRDAPLPTSGTASVPELALVPWRELAAVTARTSDDATPTTMEAILHHEAVVEAVRQRVPALPVRFGTVFRDESSVASALAERYEPLAADLERLGDKVELSLTALWADPPSDDEPTADVRRDPAWTSDHSGARYLLARAAELRRDDATKERARAASRALDAVLGALALDRRVSLVPTPRVALRTSYLLDAADVDAFRAAFDTMRREHGELRMLLTGPWPPYSFVRRAEGEDGTGPGDRFAALARTLTDTMGGRPG